MCFITVAGFLSGPGFKKMRDWLRRTADHIWVVNCSPEGHQPEVATRIFQGVQQPVCIVMVSRARAQKDDEPAKVRYVALPEGRRDQKFEALAALTIDSVGWQDCPTEWRAPFLPASTGDWTTYPALDELFAYNGSGTQAKRTWVIAPDDSSLCSRWDAMIAEPNLDKKEELFHPTLRKGVPADRHIRSVVREPIPGFSPTLTTVADETGICIRPVRYAFRSVDRQWIIPDSRVITQPNAEIWQSCSASQLFATAPHDRAPTTGPALTITASPPDLHHYNGRGGRVLPLWRDATAACANMPPRLIERIRRTHGDSCTCEDLFAYIAAVAAHPGYTARFAENLVIPGLRIPLTADQALWNQAVDQGRQVIWLHTFGERCADKSAGRPAGSPRPPQADLAKIPKGGSIPTDPENMPDEMKYDAGSRTLHVGKGRIENVPPAVWEYEVSGKRVLTQWFSYRKKTRTKPQMGDKRPPSKLSEIQPDGWLAEYTTELLNVIHVLGLLVQLEPQQKTLLNEICDGPLISRADLEAAGALECPPKWKKAMRAAAATLFDEQDDESAGDE